VKKATFTPSNSIVFVSDNLRSPAPDHLYGELISPGESCVSVGCYPEVDGPTDFVLGKSEEVAPNEDPAFDGLLDTPTKSLIIATVLDDIVLEDKVADLNTRVRIWVDHPRWPQNVIVGWG
jgi:hypothetical protein